MRARIPSWRNWSLAVRLTLFISVLVAGIVIAITALTLRREQIAFREELQQQAEVLLGGIGGAAADALYTGDVDEIDDLIQGLGRREILVFARAYDVNGRILADAIDPSQAFGTINDPFAVRLLGSESIIFDWYPDRLIAGQAVIAGREVLGAVSVGLPTARLDERLATVRNQGFAQALAAVALGIVVAFIFSRSVTRPLAEMVQVTQQMAGGDMAMRMNETGGSEVGALAGAFNDLADRLQQNIGSLEQRARIISTSAEISRQLSTILDTNELVREVVNLVQSAFGYYHVHIYQVDEETRDLVMAGGTGDAGVAMLAGGHRISAGQGLVGRSAGTNAVVLVENVSLEPGWLPNPLLPDTRSEVAVPIAIGGQVLGVLDVQEDKIGGLGGEDVSLLESVANQIAIALRNARLYEEVQQRARQEAVVNQIGQQIRSATDIDTVLQIAARELGTALQAERAQVQLGRAGNGRQQGRV